MKQTLKYSFILLILVSLNALGANPELDWKVHESTNFKIYYPETLASYVLKVDRLAEESHSELSTYLKWTPKEKTNVVLIDEFDQANGFASPLPRNTITLFIQPPTNGELLVYEDWLKMLIHHEYTHTLHIDKALDIPAFLRSVFGRFVLFFPNALHPNWFQEGLATYLETDEENGIGRGQSDFFEMMMRTEIMNGFKPVSRINVINPHDWPLNTAYLYGVYFFKFIKDVYGEKAILDLVDNYSNNIVPYRVSSNPILVTGKDLETLWGEFEYYVAGYFKPQIDRIKSKPLTDTELVNNEFFSFGEFAVEKDHIWFSATDKYLGSNLYRQRVGQSNAAELQIQLNSTGSLDINAQGKVLISQIEICDQYNSYYDLYVFEQGELNRLTKCSRYRQARWLSDSRILALRFDSGIPYVDELSADGQFVKNHWSGKAGDIVASIDVDQSNVIATLKRGAEPWQLVILKGGQWKYLTDSPMLKVSPSISNGVITFTQAQLGQLEVHQLDIKTGSVKRLTHSIGGWGQAVVEDKERGYGLSYTNDGYQLKAFTLKEEPLLYFNQAGYIKSKKEDSGESLKGREVAKAIGQSAYSPLPSLLPTYWMPVFSSDGELSQLGVFTSGSDVLGNHIYTAQLTYESTTSTPLISTSYIYANKWVGAYSKSLSDFGRLEGELIPNGSTDEVFEEKEQWLLGRMFPFVSVGHSFYPFLAIANEKINLLTVNRSTLLLNESENNWIGAGVIYDGLRNSRWAADSVQGWQATLSVESANLADSNVREGDVLNLNSRHYMTFDNDHVLAQRLFMGIGFESNSLFQLGGSSSDPYIGPGVILNERSYPLRGYEEADGLIGENAVLHSIEYRLPFKWRDHTIMAPPIGVSGWSIRGFLDNGFTWRDGESASEADHKTGVGAELVFDSNLFYYLNLKFRLGLASGISEGGQEIIYTEFGGSF